MPNALESLAEQILNDVLELPPAEWSAAAHRACGGDADLHSRVCNLLRAFTTAGKFLLDPTVVSAADGLLGSNATHEVVEQPGDAVGPYTLLERIGEGGSGVVFMARHDGAVHPLVALKIIKPSRDAVARFDAEREALSMMDHPGIVKLLDSGTTPRGRPYLVMELVSGSPVTKYADRCELSKRDRVALAVQLCRAVHHAHHHGIVHRDLKPSNILAMSVNGRTIVKVIDFGIAGSSQLDSTERAGCSVHSGRTGTPKYMSPEQADGDGADVDARSDVYSLGVVLHELLAGTPPDAKPLRRMPLDPMPEIIADAAADAGQPNRQLQGDLGRVVTKALEKDPGRRYDTAAALADDLSRSAQL